MKERKGPIPLAVEAPWRKVALEYGLINESLNLIWMKWKVGKNGKKKLTCEENVIWLLLFMNKRKEISKWLTKAQFTFSYVVICIRSKNSLWCIVKGDAWTQSQEIIYYIYVHRTNYMCIRRKSTTSREDWFSYCCMI